MRVRAVHDDVPGGPGIDHHGWRPLAIARGHADDVRVAVPRLLDRPACRVSSRPAFQRWDGSGAPDRSNAAIDLFASGRSQQAFASAAETTKPLAAFVADGIAANARVRGNICPDTPDAVEPVSVANEVGTLKTVFTRMLASVTFN